MSSYELHVSYNGAGFLPVRNRIHPCRGPVSAHVARMKDIVAGAAFGIAKPVPIDFEIRPAKPKDKFNRPIPAHRYNYTSGLDECLQSERVLAVLVSPLGKQKARIAILP